MMLKKNIIAKILLSSLMAPSLLVSTIPVYAAPGDSTEQSVSDSEDQQIPDAESESDEQSSDIDILSLIPLPNINISPEKTDLNIPTLRVPRRRTVFNITDPISERKIKNNLEIKKYIINHFKNGVLDLSGLSFYELDQNAEHIVENIAKLNKVNSVKFSYKHLYHIVCQEELHKHYGWSRYFNKFISLIRNIIGFNQNYTKRDLESGENNDSSHIGISFDYILPFAPHPLIPNVVIGMRTFYDRFQWGFNQRITCDSVIIYTNPCFTISDWLMEITPKQCLSHDIYPLNSIISNNKLNHVVICGEPHMETFDEDCLSIKNSFKKFYGYTPKIEFDNSLHPLFKNSNSPGVVGKRKLEPVYLANVLSYLQPVDNDELVLQQNFNCVSKNAGEAVKILKTTDPDKFIQHSAKTMQKLVPNIESFTLTESSFLSLYKTPSLVEELHKKLTDNDKLKRIVIDIKPRDGVFQKGNIFKGNGLALPFKGNGLALSLYNDISSERMKNLLLELKTKKKDLKIEIQSLSISPLINRGKPASSALLDFAKDNGIFIKFLYIDNTASDDFNFLEFIQKYNSVINNNTVIILNKPTDENSLKAITSIFPGIRLITKNQLYAVN